MLLRQRTDRIDGILLLMILVLTGLGLVVLYSASTYNGQVRFHGDTAYYFKKQFFAMALGVIVLYAVSRMDYHRLTRFAVPGYLLSLVLSGAVLLFGDTYNGSKRWLSLGPLSFQPSEFAKPAVILLLASVVCRLQKKRVDIWARWSFFWCCRSSALSGRTI